jgi:hypothetical protein
MGLLGSTVSNCSCSGYESPPQVRQVLCDTVPLAQGSRLLDRGSCHVCWVAEAMVLRGARIVEELTQRNDRAMPDQTHVKGPCVCGQ